MQRLTNKQIALRLLILMCGYYLASTLSLMFNINPSGGAKGDLFETHLPTIAMYKAKDFVFAMRNQESAMGPLYYLIFSFFDLGTAWLKITNLFLLLISSLAYVFILLKYVHRNLDFLSISMLFCALSIANPFVFGPALWANPDTLALFLYSISLLCLVTRNDTKSVFLSGLFMSLSVLTRQMLFPYLIIHCLYILNEYGLFINTKISDFWKNKLLIYKLLLVSSPSIVALAVMYCIWNGVVPTAYAIHSSLSFTPALISVASIALLLIPSLFIRIYQEQDYRALAVCLMISFFFDFFQLLSFPHLGGGIVEKVFRLSPILFYSLLSMGFYFLYALFRQHIGYIPLIAILLFFSSFMVFGNIFYQKYIEPYFLILSITYIILFVHNPKIIRLNIAYIFSLYSVLFVVALRSYQLNTG